MISSIDNRVIPVSPFVFLLYFLACPELRMFPEPHIPVAQLFEKYKALTLYMPPWDWDEIEASLPLFPRVTTEQAEQLFKQYGGIARAVLARGHLPAAFKSLQSALSEASPAKILQQVSGPSRKVCALATLCFQHVCQLCCCRLAQLSGCLCRISVTV